jgi:tyrosyl-DNA phosphodiesterase 1
MSIMEDEKKVSALKASEVIDLVNDDSDESSHDYPSWSQPSMAKRSRQENETATPNDNEISFNNNQQPSHDIPTTRQCPIKIFATYQDEQTRHGIHSSHWSYLHCWTLRELLGLDHNPNDQSLHENKEHIDFMIICNFMMDLDYLTQDEAPELLSIPTTLVFYHHLCGDPQRSMNLWKQRSTGRVHFIRRDPNERSEAITTPIPFGCHHTKLFLVGYSSPSTGRRRLRVIVHTCNLLPNDVHLKCQGAYVQDFFRKEHIFSSSPFEAALIDYLATYRYLQKHTWYPASSNDLDPEEPSFLLDQIGNYDFSTAKAVLIPSVPGYHKPSTTSKDDVTTKWGYLAVKKAIQAHVLSSSSSVRGRSIVCQFSSIGSLSDSYLRSLWNAWDVNRLLQGTKSTSGHFLRPPERPYQFELVYPTYDEIAASVEGVMGGASVPGSTRNVSKPFLQTLWHRWTSTLPMSRKLLTGNKGKHVPHIKTYYQVDEENEGMLWFMIGSQNLSKAAWGEQQNGIRGQCYKIFHWELGVFVSASTLGVDRLVPLGYVKSNNKKERENEHSSLCEIPLPYPFRPERHGPNDRAWTTDMMNG